MSNADAVPGAGPVLVSLFLILALLAAVAIAARRARRQGWLRPAQGTSAIHIIASRAVGFNSSLLIVEAEGSRFLVGSSRGGMVAIGRLGGDVEVL
jgi:flagellar biogenesis protein FliO